MTENKDGTFTYLIVPSAYECVYRKLLIKMSDLGIDIIKDCNTTCKGNNKEVINCWNMFNAACCAYNIGRAKEANFMMNYINTSLSFNCKEIEVKDLPSINSFKLNIDTTIVGDQTVKYNTAEFNIVNKDIAESNSLIIYQVVDGNKTMIASGLSLDSPVTFKDTTLNAKEGQTYSWTASINDAEGTTYYADKEFKVSCVAPPKTSTMYIGHTSIAPTEFQNMSIDDIMGIPGNTAKVITGSSNVKFVIHQEQKIHYLLIPDDMELVWAEYGTVLITTLWDGTGNNSAYFTTNPGGTFEGVNYKVFFLYSPIVFDDDIRITVKNK